MPWEKTEHDFTRPQADYSSEPNFQPCIKVSLFFKKLDSIDHDTFFKHWRTVHADLIVATQAFRKNIVRYAQHHQTPEMKDCVRDLGGNVLDYDGKEYAALKDDCDRFMILPATYMVGYEHLIVGDDSKALAGKDGIDITKLR
ncbi:EthD domain-containing protein [Xylaria cf. heliscus]|nr:EthD domain-containing protein [Xylaria cf. heliscus]